MKAEPKGSVSPTTPEEQLERWLCELEPPLAKRSEPRTPWLEALDEGLRHWQAFSNFEVLALALLGAWITPARAVEATRILVHEAARRAGRDIVAFAGTWRLRRTFEIVAESIRSDDVAANLVEILDALEDPDQVHMAMPLVLCAAHYPAAREAGLRAAFRAAERSGALELLKAYTVERIGESAYRRLFESSWAQIDHDPFVIDHPSIHFGLLADLLELAPDAQIVARNVAQMQARFDQLEEHRNRDTQDYPSPIHGMARAWTHAGSIPRALELAETLTASEHVSLVSWLVPRLPEHDPLRISLTERAVELSLEIPWLSSVLELAPERAPELFEEVSARWRVHIEGSLEFLSKTMASTLRSMISQFAELAAHVEPGRLIDRLDEVVEIRLLLGAAAGWHPQLVSPTLMMHVDLALLDLVRELPAAARSKQLLAILGETLWDPWATPADGDTQRAPLRASLDWLALHEHTATLSEEWLSWTQRPEFASFVHHEVLAAVDEIKAVLPSDCLGALSERILAMLVPHASLDSLVRWNPTHLFSQSQASRLAAAAISKLVHADSRLDEHMAMHARDAAAELLGAAPCAPDDADGRGLLDRAVVGDEESVKATVEGLVLAAWHCGGGRPGVEQALARLIRDRAD